MDFYSSKQRDKGNATEDIDPIHSFTDSLIHNCRPIRVH